MSKKPRILAVDFEISDVKKLSEAGFTAYQALTGIFDNEFYSPVDVQNVDVALINLQPDLIDYRNERLRKPRADSVEKQIFYRQLAKEVQAKHGWIIIFVKRNAQPYGCTAFGAPEVGVIVDGRSIKAPDWNNDVTNQHRIFAPFRAEKIFCGNQREVEILSKYSQDAKYQILAKVNSGSHYEWESLIMDEAADQNALALRLLLNAKEDVWDSKTGKLDARYYHGAVLVLPDYEKKNVDVALDLLREIIPEANYHLFDSVQNTWLSEYLPAPALKKYFERDSLMQDTKKRVTILEDEAAQLINDYEWLTGLLISEGDNFTSNTKKALEFLGFRVEDIDSTVPLGEPKKEDLQIFEDAEEFFVLGEMKATTQESNRSANKDMITKTIAHQNRYARENKCSPPNALLIVNHSIQLSPENRLSRFYQGDKEDRARCLESGISAIDSVALHALCQDVLAEKMSKDEARILIRESKGIVTKFEKTKSNN